MEPTPLADPTLALFIASIASVSTVLAAILPALIGRGSKARDPEPPDLDIVAEQDGEIAQLERENRHLRDYSADLIRENERLHQRLRTEQTGDAHPP